MSNVNQYTTMIREQSACNKLSTQIVTII